MKILAVGAHPDDIEFGCAPLLLLEAQPAEGRPAAEIKLLVMSRGEAGSAGTPEERAAESAAAAKLLGASLEFVDFRGDCHLDVNSNNALRLAGQIRRFQPDMVLAPSPEPNQHPDHVAAGKLVRDACRLARYGGLVDLGANPAHRIGQLYFYNITNHGHHPPDIVIDISGVCEKWQQVMECHATQTRNKRYVELQLATARALGLSIGVEYAIGVYANDPVRVERLSALRLSSRCF